MPRNRVSKGPPAPKPPADVTKEVKAEFRRLVALMGDRAVEADELALLMLATSWNTWRTARAQVDALGPIVMSGGTAIPNPNLTIADQAHRQILALSKELGLTPASRKKVAKEEEDDPAWIDEDDDDLDDT